MNIVTYENYKESHEKRRNENEYLNIRLVNEIEPGADTELTLGGANFRRASLSPPGVFLAPPPGGAKVFLPRYAMTI